MSGVRVNARGGMKHDQSKRAVKVAGRKAHVAGRDRRRAGAGICRAPKIAKRCRCLVAQHIRAGALFGCEALSRNCKAAKFAHAWRARGRIAAKLIFSKNFRDCPESTPSPEVQPGEAVSPQCSRADRRYQACPEPGATTSGADRPKIKIGADQRAVVPSFKEMMAI